MTKKFELEKRALLEAKEIDKVISLLDKSTLKKETFRRFSIVFWDHSELEPSETYPYDFRIRITGKVSLFTLKYGDWRGGGREEYEFHFATSELSSVLNLMRVLGYKWGTTTFVERRNYKYKEMDVTVDRYLDDGKGILEVERECRSEKDFEKGERQIDKIFGEWGITPLTKEGFVEFIRYTNNKKENYFNLAKFSVSKYLRLWKEKFN